LRFGPGAPASAAPEGDALETLWRTYYASIFNPARLNLRAMQQELPRRHWSTLPEAQLIAPLARRAATRVEGMLARESSESERYLPTLPTLSTLRAALPACQACGLCGPATQAVFGEGPEHARLVLVGEQPGDEEDRLGRPFVGPAGVVLDAALQEAGIDRREVYLTNAVKHFKFEERGRRRIHQKPSAGEIRACKGWLQAELTTLQPQVLVCLGATAAQALLGPRFSVSRTVGSPSPCPPSPACSRPTTRRRSCAWMT
jgi:uracil-DNA glycosylase family protein